MKETYVQQKKNIWTKKLENLVLSGIGGTLVPITDSVSNKTGTHRSSSKLHFIRCYL